jgi:hypothetical protein
MGAFGSLPASRYPEGIKACRRWSSEARAIPPVAHPHTPTPRRGVSARHAFNSPLSAPGIRAEHQAGFFTSPLEDSAIVAFIGGRRVVGWRQATASGTTFRWKGLESLFRQEIPAHR